MPAPTACGSWPWRRGRVASRAGWTTNDERDLVLAGFLTFSDPPLPEAKAAVEALRRDGVTLKILSGDDAAVAPHLCEALGLDQAASFSARTSSG